MQALAIAIIAGLPCLGGCITGSVHSVPADRPAVYEFREDVERDGSITFHNYGGVFEHSDGDLEFRFYPHGHVSMTVSSIAVYQLDGTYNLEPGGRLVCIIPNSPFGGPGLTLFVGGDARSLFLRRSETDGDDRGMMSFRTVDTKTESISDPWTP
ncbi:MAG TPA: hypothetical protein VFE47_17120 [Tepidisphaeraceae bacterium]|jgi:hypothetical protein|nr:hypothetical protein [Tepidisphaeraceae bacterium]